MGIVEAADQRDAERYAKREIGSYFEPTVRKATQDDLVWLELMGGGVQETDRPFRKRYPHWNP